MTFAECLRQQLEAKKKGRGFGEWLLLDILCGGDLPRRHHQLARMERLVRTYIGAEDDEPIDWGSIPWEESFEAVLEILVSRLPILLALPIEKEWCCDK